MSDCDETTQHLGGNQQPDQLGAGKLSEKNCVEIVTKLVELQLVDLIKTTDEKEYLTPQQLDKEIRDELFVSGGRISLVEIASVISVELGHVKQTAQAIVEADDDIHLVIDQLVSQRYLEDLCRQLNERLQQEGIVSIQSIAEELFLPSDFLINQVNMQLGSVIEGFKKESDPGVILTSSNVKINKLREERVYLSKFTEPTFVSDCSYESGEGVESGSPESKFAKDCASSEGAVDDLKRQSWEKEGPLEPLCSRQGHDELNNCPQPENCEECQKKVIKVKEVTTPTDNASKKEGRKEGDLSGSNVCNQFLAEGHSDMYSENIPQSASVEEISWIKTKDVYVCGEDLRLNIVTTEIHLKFSGGDMKNGHGEVRVTGYKCDVPRLVSFDQADLHPVLMENLAKRDFSQPTPVQRTCIPIISAGRDIMVSALPGAGKTTAFLLPILDKLMKDEADSRIGATIAQPQCVVLTPTRDLAIQIDFEVFSFSSDSMIKSMFGRDKTSSRSRREQQITNGCNVFVATPQILMDYLNEGTISLASVEFLVLDEADRLLELDEFEKIEWCVKECNMPPEGVRQTLMLASTFQDEKQVAAQNFIGNYLFVVEATNNEWFGDLTHDILQVTCSEKKNKLKEILLDPNRNPAERTIVFVENNEKIHYVVAFLSDVLGIPTSSIFGEAMRNLLMRARNFIEGFHPVLVATDLSACGLIIPGVKHVINYDLPWYWEMHDYRERLSRLGRSGNSRKVTSFFDEYDVEMPGPLVKMLKDHQIPVPNWLTEAAAEVTSEDEWD